jgi:hypothetical protein
MTPLPSMAESTLATRYERPWDVRDLRECLFYHTMDLPGVGTVHGEWDLRHDLGRYLGGENLSDKLVLEIGPASGCLTFHMETMGANVTAVDVDETTAWDIVPRSGLNIADALTTRRAGARLLRNGFWFAYKQFHSRARVVYTNVYDLPPDIGNFDVAVLGMVLLHLRDPLLALSKCAEYANTLIVTELLPSGLSDQPVCRLLPSLDNPTYDTWWSISPAFLVQFLQVLGFPRIAVSSHSALFRGSDYPLYTVAASR